MSKDDQRIRPEKVVTETIESETLHSASVVDSRDSIPRAKNPLTANPFRNLEKPASGESASSKMQASNRKPEPEK